MLIITIGLIQIWVRLAVRLYKLRAATSTKLSFWTQQQNFIAGQPAVNFVILHLQEIDMAGFWKCIIVILATNVAIAVYHASHRQKINQPNDSQNEIWACSTWSYYMYFIYCFSPRVSKKLIKIFCIQRQYKDLIETRILEVVLLHQDNLKRLFRSTK